MITKKNNIDDLISEAVSKTEKSKGWDVVEPSAKLVSSKGVDKWTNSDLGKYADSKYFENFKESLNPGRAYLAIIIAKIRKEFYLVFGSHPDNQAVKSYIDFFFEEKLKVILTDQKQKFTLSMLAWDSCIKDFKSRYELLHNSKGKTTVRQKENIDDLLSSGTPSTNQPTKEEVLSKSKMGLRSVLLNFGLVHCICFLKSTGKDHETIKSNITALVKKLCNNDQGYWKNIKSVTEKYNPYPKNLLDRNLLDEITKELSFTQDVKITSND